MMTLLAFLACRTELAPRSCNNLLRGAKTKRAEAIQQDFKIEIGNQGGLPGDRECPRDGDRSLFGGPAARKIVNEKPVCFQFEGETNRFRFACAQVFGQGWIGPSRTPHLDPLRQVSCPGTDFRWSGGVVKFPMDGFRNHKFTKDDLELADQAQLQDVI